MKGGESILKIQPTLEQNDTEDRSENLIDISYHKVF